MEVSFEIRSTQSARVEAENYFERALRSISDVEVVSSGSLRIKGILLPQTGGGQIIGYTLSLATSYRTTCISSDGSRRVCRVLLHHAVLSGRDISSLCSSAVNLLNGKVFAVARKRLLEANDRLLLESISDD